MAFGKTSIKSFQLLSFVELSVSPALNISSCFPVILLAVFVIVGQCVLVL